jgi:all-trans-retinol 13,14-reductase
MIGLPYKRANLDGPWDAIVIGSGIGGLTTANLLARHAGQRVLVLERHYEVGGFTHVFRRPGWEWDVGVHYIGNVGSPRAMMRRIFDHLSDGALTWAAMPEVYDRIVLGSRVYDFPAGLERFRAQMKEYFPGEERAIDRYIAAVLSAVKWLNLYMAEKAMPPFLGWLVGGLMRWPFLRWSSPTTLQVLRRFTRNEELIGVLTAQWGDYGLPPAESSFAAHAVVAAHYFGGASYPVGGASRFAETFTPAVRSAGGTVVINAEVASIALERGRAVGVRMADGRELRAPRVISGAGAVNTYTRLLPALPSTRALVRSMERLPASMAHLCLYVGLKQPLSPRDGTNLWIYGGPEHDSRLAQFIEDPKRDFPVLYVSFPSAKDPTFGDRYPGRGTIEVVAPAPYSMFAPWEGTRWKKRGEAYDALKERLKGRLLEGLIRHVPDIAGQVDYLELSTPLSTSHFTHHAQGAVYGVAQVPARFRLRALGPRTPVKGLYLTGADAAISGVAGAVAGGILAASAILGRNMMSVVTSARSVPK